jgi:hypothetical protein
MASPTDDGQHFAEREGAVFTVEHAPSWLALTQDGRTWTGAVLPFRPTSLCFFYGRTCT